MHIAAISTFKSLFVFVCFFFVDRNVYLVIGSNVQDDGETLVRFDSGQSRVKRQFSDRNSHSVSAEIAQSQDALAVRNDNKSHVLFRPNYYYYFN